jgi:hypothetical protein
MKPMKDVPPRLKGRRRVERAIRRSNTPTSDTAWAEIASRLLEFQQKLDAWDCLYNQELSELRKGFSQLRAHERGAPNNSSEKGISTWWLHVRRWQLRNSRWGR